MGIGHLRGGRPSLRLGLVALALCSSLVARALVLDAGVEATPAPSPDPAALSIVGDYGEFSAVHVGDGWILTANHGPTAQPRFGGETYAMLPGSWAVIENRDDESRGPDLRMFRVAPTPPLPRVEIAAEAPPVGSSVLLIGRGRTRGDAVRWQGIPGYRFGPRGSIRWGTNIVERLGLWIDLGPYRTRALAMVFNREGSPREVQAAVGDSGGAVLFRGEDGWELVGMIFGATAFPDQPPHLALYGNFTYAAELAYYRDQIVALRDAPSP